jgi:GT2 family glycosyltransferase
MPAVTVAIVAYQSGPFLQRCLDALAAQSFTDFEAVVADNASTDGSVEGLRLPDARFRVVPMGSNLGFAAANNRVAEMSGATWLATLNPDAEAEPDWLQALIEATERWPQADGFGSTQLSLDRPEILDGVGDVWHAAGIGWRARIGWPATMIPPEAETFGACAAAALYRLETFRRLGGFDERYFCYCEDSDFAYRLRLDGGISVQVPSAVVRHAGSAISGRTSPFTLFHGHRNLVWAFIKNTPGAWLPILIPWRIGYGLLLILAALRVKGARHVARAQWAALMGMGPVLEDRRRVQAARKVRLGVLAKSMAWGPLAPWKRDIL